MSSTKFEVQAQPASFFLQPRYAEALRRWAEATELVAGQDQAVLHEASAQVRSPEASARWKLKEKLKSAFF